MGLYAWGLVVKSSHIKRARQFNQPAVSWKGGCEPSHSFLLALMQATLANHACTRNFCVSAK